MKIVIISPKNRTLFNFRGDLIQDLKKRNHSVLVTGPNLTDIEKVKELGVRFFLLPMKKNGLNFFEDLRYLKSLIRLFKQEKPDIILGYTIKPVVYGSLAGRAVNVKKIVSLITGVGYVFISNSAKAKIISVLVKCLYRIALSFSHVVIFQNKDDRHDFIKANLVDRRKCNLVHGSGVNMDRFKPAPLPNQLTFFMLSRIMKSKGVREYLQAAKKVKKNYPEVRFMLLGAFERIQDSLSREYVQSFIDNQIIDYYEETDDVRKYYQQCSVFVLPSYREGTPRTVLEAMAMGRPIITTDAPGCKETVMDGINGFLVPVKDKNALAKKMIWFVKNPNNLYSMGKESHRFCLEKYDVHKINMNILQKLDLIHE